MVLSEIEDKRLTVSQDEQMNTEEILEPTFPIPFHVIRNKRNPVHPSQYR
jgi:hypothetical protein